MRENILKSIGTASLFAASTMAVGAVGQTQAKNVRSSVKKPNLVFVFSDQQSYDMLGCYGNKQIITPNLDKFSAQG